MQYLSKNTQKRAPRNVLKAHQDGTFSIRIDGKWRRKLRELSQTQYLSLLQSDRERLILREFQTGRSVTGSPVVVSRPVQEYKTTPEWRSPDSVPSEVPFESGATEP